MFRRFLVQTCFLAFVLGSACPARSAAPASRGFPSQIIEGLGSGAVELDGTWRFHTGDNPGWCGPDLYDSDWEALQTNATWGVQGHPSYTGYAWYRKHITIVPAPHDSGKYQILIPKAEDAYEVYWNCKLIGRHGQFPPHPSWFYAMFPQSFPLEDATSGVLAVRFWKAPLGAFDSDILGGFYVPPILGSPDVIQLNEDSFIWQEVRGQLFDYSLVLLRAFITALCIFLWWRNREQLFIWVAVFTITPIALESLEQLFLIPFTYPLARFINQPLYMLYYSVSVWFLLLWLLELHDNARLRRLTTRLAWLGMALAFADGLLALFWGSAGPAMQWADGILVTCMLLLETYSFVLVTLGLRGRHHISRWAVALGALVLQIFHSIADISALGQRFTHWSVYTALIDAPLFEIQGVQFTPEKIVELGLFASILFAMYRYILEQQARRAALEQEMQSAREIQQVLMPETVPAIEGYAISSAYVPAQEVGGDFFQILPHADGSFSVALGDVSGKGLKAAMNVSMIVGALRAQAAITSSPAAMLEGLNRSLMGRMSGGFATALLFRVEPDGALVLANAGHLPPYLNGSEFPIDASLPLGVLADNCYSETTIRLNTGDELLVYTDGLLESRDENGQMYGFERLGVLLGLRPTPHLACQRAVEFGQQDDITVLTLTRLAAGEEASTSLTAPLFDVAMER